MTYRLLRIDDQLAFSGFRVISRLQLVRKEMRFSNMELLMESDGPMGPPRKRGLFQYGYFISVSLAYGTTVEERPPPIWILYKCQMGHLDHRSRGRVQRLPQHRFLISVRWTTDVEAQGKDFPDEQSQVKIIGKIIWGTLESCI